VGAKGTGAVGKAKVGPRRESQHVGAVIPAVGHERDAVERCQHAQPVRSGHVAVGHGHPPGPHPGQPVDTRPHGTVEALAGLPHDAGTDTRRPPGHVLVVADHGDRQRHAGGRHVRRHGAHERNTIRIRQGRPESPLGLVECLDRDQDDLGSQVEVDRVRRVVRWRRAGPRHADSVGVHAKVMAGPP
jgi:hypothetical protein